MILVLKTQSFDFCGLTFGQEELNPSPSPLSPAHKRKKLLILGLKASSFFLQRYGYITYIVARPYHYSFSL